MHVLFRKTKIHDSRALTSAIRTFKSVRIPTSHLAGGHDDINVAKSHFEMLLDTPAKVAQKSINSNRTSLKNMKQHILNVLNITLT